MTCMYIYICAYTYTIYYYYIIGHQIFPLKPSWPLPPEPPYIPPNVQLLRSFGRQAPQGPKPIGPSGDTKTPMEWKENLLAKVELN